MHTVRNVFVALALSLCFGLMASAAYAQAQPRAAWPGRPVRFIVSLGPGSSADIGGRLVADRLAKKWGPPVVIENRPGGDGIIAINAFVSSNDDHVLLLTPTSSFIAHPCGRTPAFRTSSF